MPHFLENSFGSTLAQVPNSKGESQPLNHRIPLEEAVGMVQRYRERKPESVHGVMFDRTIFEDLLGQEGCLGVRIYHAEGADGAQTMVLVGVDAQGNDLYQGTIGENGLACPPHCPIGSPFLW